jgi:hypothetical protein
MPSTRLSLTTIAFPAASCPVVTRRTLMSRQ